MQQRPPSAALAKGGRLISSHQFQAIAGECIACWAPMPSLVSDAHGSSEGANCCAPDASCSLVAAPACTQTS